MFKSQKIAESKGNLDSFWFADKSKCQQIVAQREIAQDGILKQVFDFLINQGYQTKIW